MLIYLLILTSSIFTWQRLPIAPREIKNTTSTSSIFIISSFFLGVYFFSLFLSATISVAFTLQRYNCPKSYTFTNARLQGGLKAGHFRRLGPPDDTELCVQRCCDQRSCDLVAWVGEHCYSVSCVSREMCKPVRLPSYEKGMRLLYIASRDDAEDEGTVLTGFILNISSFKDGSLELFIILTILNLQSADSPSRIAYVSFLVFVTWLHHVLLENCYDS